MSYKFNSLILAMGLTSTISNTYAGVASYDWQGVFTMLDPEGVPLQNTSILKGNNRFQTPISGTMRFDTITGAGTATLSPFDFFGASLPSTAEGIRMQSIGDGMGNAGSLIVANMIFNWGQGKSSMPVSLVLDASGFLSGELSSGGINSAVPASDGTYVGANVSDTATGPYGYTGYLGLGPIPLATTAWNTSNIAGCVEGNCDGVNPSGVLPIIDDTAINIADYTSNTGGSIGGSPIQTGAFQNFNANFDITTLLVTGYSPSEAIAPDCDVLNYLDFASSPCNSSVVPVPAAVWLFGSGLLFLVGAGRQKKRFDQ